MPWLLVLWRWAAPESACAVNTKYVQSLGRSVRDFTWSDVLHFHEHFCLRTVHVGQGPTAVAFRLKKARFWGGAYLRMLALKTIKLEYYNLIGARSFLIIILTEQIRSIPAPRSAQQRAVFRLLPNIWYNGRLSPRVFVHSSSLWDKFWSDIALRARRPANPCTR